MNNFTDSYIERNSDLQGSSNKVNTKRVALLREEYKMRTLQELGDAALMAARYLKEKIVDGGLDDKHRIKVAEIILSKVVPNARFEDVEEGNGIVENVAELKSEIRELIKLNGFGENDGKT